MLRRFVRLGTVGKTKLGVLGPWTIWSTKLLVVLLWVKRGEGSKEGSSAGGSRMLKISSWWTRLLKMSTRWLLLQEPTLMRRRAKKYFQSRERFILLGVEDVKSIQTWVLVCMDQSEVQPRQDSVENW